MELPLISILMPAKNAARYLEECLRSVLEQTYSNWELIAIDDHSGDDTALLLTRYAKEDDRIQVHKAQGNGIIDALRQAYSLSKGQYISRMDADDRMTPGKLKSLLDNLLAKGNGFLATGCVTYFSEDILGNGYKRYASWLNGLTRTGTNYREIYKECVIPSPCWMVHRDDLEGCGAFQPDTYPEDYDLCFRFYKAGLKVIPCDEVLHHWRDYPERTSRNSENYEDNTFLHLKTRYFVELDWNRDRPLILWGAGGKGKEIAKQLIKHETPFQWICNNPNKIGQDIYGVTLMDQYALNLKAKPQIIIAIANPKQLNGIKSSLHKIDRQSGLDDFYFC